MGLAGSNAVPDATSAIASLKTGPIQLLGGTTAAVMWTLPLLGCGRAGVGVNPTASNAPRAFPGTVYVQVVTLDGNPSSISQFFTFARHRVDLFYMGGVVGNPPNPLWSSNDVSGNYLGLMAPTYREYAVTGAFLGVYITADPALAVGTYFDAEVSLYGMTG